MDFDLLPAGIRVLFPDLDLLDQHDSQLAGQCVQLQKLLGLFHQIRLLPRLFLSRQFFINLRQPPLLAAFFSEEILIQIHELPFAQNAGDLIQVQILECDTPFLQLGGQGFLLLQKHIPFGVPGPGKLHPLQGVVVLDIVPQPLQHQFNQPVQADGVAGTQLFLPAVGIQLAPEIVDLLRPLFAVGGLAPFLKTIYIMQSQMPSGHLLLSCVKMAATAKISSFAYLR